MVIVAIDRFVAAHSGPSLFIFFAVSVDVNVDGDAGKCPEQPQEVAAVLTAKSRIAADIYRIRLKISTDILYTLQFAEKCQSTHLLP